MVHDNFHTSFTPTCMQTIQIRHISQGYIVYAFHFYSRIPGKVEPELARHRTIKLVFDHVKLSATINQIIACIYGYKRVSHMELES